MQKNMKRVQWVREIEASLRVFRFIGFRYGFHCTTLRKGYGIIRYMRVGLGDRWPKAKKKKGKPASGFETMIWQKVKRRSGLRNHRSGF
jgi:hypothetical protein